MKRNVVCIALVVTSLVLAACGSASAPTAGTGNAAASATGAAPAQGELSTVAKDIVGILKLEGTNLAVDKAQASTLLPLWQAYQSLMKSDTAAPQEIEAVQTQIDEALTGDQKDAFAAMNLTPQDMFAMAEQLGVTQGAASTNKNGNGTGSSSERPFAFNFGGGGMASDGGGGFVMPEGGPSLESGGFDPSMMTQGMPQPGQAARSGQGDRMSMMLLDPLIKLLKERAGS